jgi:tetratricopeptide (TPR) repeat protein
LGSITIFKSQIRLYYWESAFREIKQSGLKRLLFGYGQESQNSIFVKYYQPDWAIYEKIYSHPDRAHNSAIDILLTTGLFGLIAIIFFFGYVSAELIKYLRTKKESSEFWLGAAILLVLVGYFVNNLFSFSTVASFSFLLACLAIIVFLASENRQEKIVFINIAGLFKLLLFLSLLFMVSVIGFLYNIKPVIADYYLMEADKAKLRGGCQDVLFNLNRAIKWGPDNYFYQNKYIYNSLNCLSGNNSMEINSQIKNNIENVIGLIDKNELNYYTKINIAHAYALFGYYFDEKYYKMADKAYNELININSDIAVIYKDWGRMKMWQKDYDQAIEILNRGTRKIPDLKINYGYYLSEGHKKEIEMELVEFYSSLAESYSAKKIFNQTIYYYSEILKISPFDYEIYDKIADVYYGNGDKDKAALFINRQKMFKN